MISIRRLYRESQLQLSHSQTLVDLRENFDIQNLNLQSLIYEKHHLEKEITLCKEFPTPNLATAIPSAYYQTVKNLSTQIQYFYVSPNNFNRDQTHNEILDLEINELNLRKSKHEEYSNI